MQVKDIMTKHMDFLQPSATLQQVSQEMQKHDLGFLPLKENGKIAGVVTDRDITVRGMAKGLDHNAQVKQVMTSTVISVHENDDLKKAAQLMEKRRVRRLVVLNQEDAIAGVISLGDIATKCKDINLSGEIIHAVSEKSK